MTTQNRPLDRTDRAILVALRNDARITNKELAAQVHLSPSSCHARLQRLLTEGVIRGFHASLDARALGVGIQALITLRLQQHSRAAMDAAWEELASLPEVVTIYRLAGVDDLLMHVAVRDVKHLRQLTLERLSEKPEVGSFETALIYESRQAPGLPDLLEAESTPR